jgi:hypothetical protein
LDPDPATGPCGGESGRAPFAFEKSCDLTQHTYAARQTLHFVAKSIAAASSTSQWPTLFNITYASCAPTWPKVPALAAKQFDTALRTVKD